MVAKAKKKPASKKPAKKTGRPTIYTKQLGAEICLRMCQGRSVRKLSQDEDMPTDTTIFAWACDPDHPFSEQYAKARITRAEALVDEITDIADYGGDDVPRARLMVDTRKWFAGKVAPKLYGDKLQHTGEGGEGPVNITINQSGKGARAD